MVCDDMGQYEAIAVVDHLLGQGLAVTVATRLPAFAGPLDFSLHTDAAPERFHRTGSFRSLERQRLVEVGPAEVWVRPAHARDRGDARHPDDHRLPAEVIVVVGHKESETDLADALAGRVADLRLVGDAHWARDLQTAIRDGHLAGCGIA